MLFLSCKKTNISHRTIYDCDDWDAWKGTRRHQRNRPVKYQDHCEIYLALLFWVLWHHKVVFRKQGSRVKFKCQDSWVWIQVVTYTCFPVVFNKVMFQVTIFQSVYWHFVPDSRITNVNLRWNSSKLEILFRMQHWTCILEFIYFTNFWQIVTR